MPKSTSLVSKSEGGAALAVLGAYEPTQLAPSGYSGATYVQFAHPRAKNYAQMVQAIPGIEEGDPVLIRPDPALPLALKPFTFLLMKTYQHFSELDNSGNIVKSYAVSGGRDRKEHIEVVILVMAAGELYPATCTFKTTKVRAASTASKTLEAASKTDKWAALSPDHRATIAIPDPRFRFTTTVKLQPDTSKSTGLKYVTATGLCRPTTVADWQLIGAKLNDAAFAEQLQSVIDAFESRRRFVESKG